MAEQVTSAKATAKTVRIPARKARLVIDLIRGKNVAEAFGILKFTPRSGAYLIEKVLKSAVANAENNHDMDKNKLYVAQCYATQGPTLKRIQPHAQGRAFKILKRTSHITLVLKEKED